MSDSEKMVKVRITCPARGEAPFVGWGSAGMHFPIGVHIKELPESTYKAMQAEVDRGESILSLELMVDAAPVAEEPAPEPPKKGKK